ncbi:hypothetical protein TeGR_g6218 [Tetraparma gracilis]|uniref:Bifunctional lysine-specific demethylase and histidyl-hydroxylase n=1 Tax=Tetraparma gracilis TaxID=2962635 RepID=A0ABQ6MN62_9STRA|nr:hypothetical protein TeGR_g6218 [Tetraparma gracilis]
MLLSDPPSLLLPPLPPLPAPGDPFSLLLNDLSLDHPELHELFGDLFPLPPFRRADVQASLSGPGGGIGPHVDSFDVFLLQLSGRKRWCVEASPLSPAAEDARRDPASPLPSLLGFDPTHSSTLSPGDVLYLPPRVPHRGVSLDPDTVTLSFGFRAPSPRELAAAALSLLPPSLPLADPGGAGWSPSDPALLTPGLLAAAREALLGEVAALLADPLALSTVVGEAYTSCPLDRGDAPYPPPLSLSGPSSLSALGPWADPAASLSRVLSPSPLSPALHQAEGVAFAYSRHALHAGGRTLPLSGSAEALECARLACGGGAVGRKELESVWAGGGGEAKEIFGWLLEEGLMYGADFE